MIIAGPVILKIYKGSGWRFIGDVSADGTFAAATGVGRIIPRQYVIGVEVWISLNIMLRCPVSAASRRPTSINAIILDDVICDCSLRLCTPRSRCRYSR